MDYLSDRRFYRIQLYIHNSTRPQLDTPQVYTDHMVDMNKA